MRQFSSPEHLAFALDQFAAGRPALACPRSASGGAGRRAMAKKPQTRVVLVVDDDAAVRSALKFALEVEGFEVRDYDSPVALLSDRNMPPSGCFVIDYRMPVMDGLELVAVLRERGINGTGHHHHRPHQQGARGPGGEAWRPPGAGEAAVRRRAGRGDPLGARRRPPADGSEKRHAAHRHGLCAALHRRAPGRPRAPCRSRFSC